MIAPSIDLTVIQATAKTEHILDCLSISVRCLCICERKQLHYHSVLSPESRNGCLCFRKCVPAAWLFLRWEERALCRSCWHLRGEFPRTLPKTMEFLLLPSSLWDGLHQDLENYSELHLAVRVLCDLCYRSSHWCGVCNFLKSVALIRKVSTGQEHAPTSNQFTEGFHRVHAIGGWHAMPPTRPKGTDRWQDSAPPPLSRPLVSRARPPLSVPVNCPPPGLTRRRQVPLQGFYPGSEAILVWADGGQLRLGGHSVFIRLRQGGLQVALRGLRTDRADLPRCELLLLMLRSFIHSPPWPVTWCPVRGGAYTRGLGGGRTSVPLGGDAFCFPAAGRGGASSSPSASMTSTPP